MDTQRLVAVAVEPFTHEPGVELSAFGCTDDGVGLELVREVLLHRRQVAKIHTGVDDLIAVDILP